ISCDFSVMYSTINEHSRKVSQWSFIDLYKKKRAYQKEAPTIWCTECKTAIAQAELVDKEKQADLVQVEVQTTHGKPLVFATTRPELMMACIAISVHPDDKRYKEFVGKKATIPGGPIVPIIADTLTKIEFGTGVVYWCPFGDAADVEFVAKHPELKIKHIKNKDGTLNEHAGKYAGLYMNKARRQVIEDWKALGAVKSIEQKKQMTNAHERCGTPVEYLVSRQWFIKVLDVKDDLITIGKKLKFYPEFMRQRYENWVNGLKWDWCISRQRYFGIPFPVWYCKKCHAVVLADEKQLPVDPLIHKPATCACGGNDFEPEHDVLDTWATSSITPLITQKLFDGLAISKKLYPMNMRPQGHDIISTWLFYTIVKSYLHFKKLPWETAAISGWVLDPLGQKMSKSKGNVVAPQEIIAKYSADALRWAASASKLGEDSAFQDKELVTGQKFVTKLWNAAKFSAIHLQKYKGDAPKKLEVIDKWILSKMNALVKQSVENYDEFEYSKTRREVEVFFWHTFCDNYLEIAKYRLYGTDADKKKSAQYTLYNVLLNVVKLMAPITPHITEEVYQQYFAAHEKMKSVHVSAWPAFDKKLVDLDAEKIGDAVVAVVSVVRKYKSQNAMPLNAEIKEVLVSNDAVRTVENDIKAVLHAGKITVNAKADIVIEGIDLKVGIGK
ncbi:MAG TPA: valine--tRNA ligase, partial [Candidatus Nanoarchaeia archaeon]|nr:valine--tRNA ligase [Candidatus Nanoarchaeia archaeon]